MAAINRTRCDRIPRGEFVVDMDFIRDFARVFGGNDAGTAYPTGTSMAVEFYRRLGLDLVCIPAGDFINGDGDLESCTGVKRDQGLFIFSVVDGAFQSVMKRKGFADFCLSSAIQPERLGREIRLYSDEILPVIERVINKGAHGVIIADDIAYKQGTYVAPGFIAKYLLPCWRDQVLAAKRFKAPVFFHSDGNINAVLPYVVEAGFGGLQCLDPSSGMDMKTVKDVYGQCLCLMGNIDPALLSPDDVPGGGFPELARAVEELIRAMGREGGFIFGTSSGLYPGLSPEKVLFMYELADKSGRTS